MQEIARAGVGARNVTNVKTILHMGHARLIQALTDGTLTINRAIQFCKLPQAEQLEQFTRYTTERATNKVIRQSLRQPGDPKTSGELQKVLEALQVQEARQPGSVAIRLSEHNQSIILVGRDLLAQQISPEELKLT